eukprot:TRINITY_DN9786_c0_g1_i1.p1 TRINITY_DN9786_c0_g1~~TRINITY_DN9786_c0_g1_i1.p1  ORF type:complete len:499 (+),score=129.69 TRINITY_DN9786_c0_g1_i1:64-1560(+)
MFHFKSCVQLAKDIKSGVITSAALLEHFIERVEKYDGPINSIVLKNYEVARERAAEADKALERGEDWGVLHGVPITVKENNDVEGLPTTVGIEALKGHKAAQHSSPVQRLHDAGAVIFGKTNLPVGVNDVQTFNPIYGCTANPYNLDLSPGGSSGGSTAALAAGLTAVEFGGDIGGSIRYPAHCCGLWGIKPTFDVIPRRGGVANTKVSCGDPTGFVLIDLAVKGPLARYPEDLTLMLDVLCGPVAAEKRGWKLCMPKSPPQPLKEYKVAVWGTDSLCPVDDDITAAVRRTVDILRKNGATVDEEARPKLDVKKSFDTYLQLLAAADNVGLSVEAAKQAWKEADEAVGDSDEAKQARWLGQRHHEWWGAHAHRLEMCEKWEQFFEAYDFIIMPIACTTAIPHDHSGPNDQAFWKVGDRVIKGANGFTIPYHKQVFWASFAVHCFLPSTSFPAGCGHNGMPVGLQVMGPKYSDYDTITFAKVLAEAGGADYQFQPPKGF